MRLLIYGPRGHKFKKKDAKWKVSKADPPPNDFDSKNPGVSLITIDYKSKGYSKTSIKVLIY